MVKYKGVNKHAQTSTSEYSFKQTDSCSNFDCIGYEDYDSDKGGQLIQSLINQHENHVDINHYRIVKDDIEAITHQLKLWLTSSNQLDVIITTGGTGISQRDVTIEAVRPLLTKN